MTTRWDKFYAKEAQSYDQKRYSSWYGRLYASLHRSALRRSIGRVAKEGTALEIATGTGHALPVLAEVMARVVATDVTPSMLTAARAKMDDGERDIEFVLNDAFQLPYSDGVFDVVVATRFLHLFSPSEQDFLLAEMGRVLKRNGLLVVDFYGYWHWFLLFPIVAPYRALKRRRSTDDFRSRVRHAKTAVMKQGFDIEGLFGVGSYLFVLLRLLPDKLAYKLARGWQEYSPPDLAEQFLVVARKKE